MDELEVLLETRKIALEAVGWYFEQRSYKVSPRSDGGYYAHHIAERRKGMAPLIKPESSSYWDSPYMAIKACQHHAAERARLDVKGE